jgi:hypothetical protein
LNQFDAWITAIDIAFAEVFFTMLFFFGSYYVIGSIVFVFRTFGTEEADC